jgi:hypothetical protein
MTSSFVKILALVSALACADRALAQFVLVPEATGDHILQFSSFDGSAVNLDFIQDDPTSTNYNFQIPKDVIQVGNEVWVSDQISDAIYRFDLTGIFLSGITTGLDNITGMEYAHSRVYVANGGTANGAPGNAVVMFDKFGNPLGNFTVPGAPADIMAFGSDILVTNTTGDDIDRYTSTGVYVGHFHDSPGTGAINLPQQITLSNANNHVFAAGFSTPQGLYEYDSNGVQLNYLAVGGGDRGVRELGNGYIMYTDSAGIWVYDPIVQASSPLVLGTSAGYINNFTGSFPAPSMYCTPKVNSLGCAPLINYTGTPSASTGSGFVVTGAPVINNKSGLLFYGVTGRASLPFQGGTLCVKSPLRRTPHVISGGTPPPNNCTGVYAFDFNTYASGAMGGSPLPELLVPGTTVDCQWWGRDPGYAPPNNTTLSNGLEFVQMF